MNGKRRYLFAFCFAFALLSECFRFAFGLLRHLTNSIDARSFANPGSIASRIPPGRVDRDGGLQGCRAAGMRGRGDGDGDGDATAMQWRWRCNHRQALKVCKLFLPCAQVKLDKIKQIINHYEGD